MKSQCVLLGGMMTALTAFVGCLYLPTFIAAMWITVKERREESGPG
jgi:hypothetical protein